MQRIFITGHHRAGTHELAEDFYDSLKLPLVMEDVYMFDSMEMLDMMLEGKVRVFGKDGPKIVRKPEFIEQGFILQCPGLAPHCKRLAELGDVYWCYRNPETIALSMANGGFRDMLWSIMKSFRSNFPDDPIWPTLKYSDREDPHANFIGYAYLLTQVKEYFYEKHLKQYVKKKVLLEEQGYYDFSKTTSSKRPIKGQMTERIEKVKRENESLCTH